MFPLAAIVDDILKLGKQAMSTPVEIEFAINLNREAPKKPEFSLLQIRPIAEGYEEDDIYISKKEENNALLLSSSIMGNGLVDNITDLVMINFDKFSEEI